MQLENGESVVTAANVVPKYEVCNNAATNKTNKQKVNDFNPFCPSGSLAAAEQTTLFLIEEGGREILED